MLLKQTSVMWHSDMGMRPSAAGATAILSPRRGRLRPGRDRTALGWLRRQVRLSWRDRRMIAGAGGASLGLFDRLLGRQRAGSARAASSADLDHLEQWAAARSGVEAFVEPRTMVTETTVVLVAHDGEWTRRRVDGAHGAHGAQRLAKRLRIPIYDVALVWYPQRMR